MTSIATWGQRCRWGCLLSALLACSATRNRVGSEGSGDVDEFAFDEVDAPAGAIPAGAVLGNTGFQWFDEPALPRLGEVGVSLGAAQIAAGLNVSDLAVDPLGGFAIVGTSALTQQYNGLHVIRFLPSGTLDWFRQYTCSGSLTPPPIAAMTDKGTTLVAGGFAGQCAFDEFDVVSVENPPGEVYRSAELEGGPFVEHRGVHSTDVYLLASNYSGGVSGVEVIEGPGEQWPTALLASETDITLFGQFEAKVTLGDHEYFSSGGAAAADALVVHLGDGMEVDGSSQLPLRGTTAAGLRIEGGGLVVGGAGLPPPGFDWPEPDRSSGWLVALDEDDETEWGLSWFPAQPPATVTLDGQGNAYVLVAGVVPRIDGDPFPLDDEALPGMSLFKITPKGKLAWRRDVRGTVRQAHAAWRAGHIGVVASIEGRADFGDVGALEGGGPADRDAVLWEVADDSGEDVAVVGLRGDGVNDEGLAIQAHPSGGWLAVVWLSATVPAIASAGAGYLAVRFDTD